ncbi:MAG: hypothetical protein ACRBBQ_07015 [Cognatishimia sp.]
MLIYFKEIGVIACDVLPRVAICGHWRNCTGAQTYSQHALQNERFSPVIDLDENRFRNNFAAAQRKYGGYFSCNQVKN